ncbi:MAG: hypothetical protein EAZ90_14975 [Oscillatoriales cyanobacterium]|nr:MAG: hypothetical protein EAZ90_14975 [Oscillatoriales cyanobacterium]TAE69533.1 MAG: hypothetical protein EAZ86_09640 [Oscillatoriales cyanobacterium]TAG00016.1 MAG: hypothetical protein EAZ45_16365 [Oscillatoriales cyanobacterium]TAG22901.1 MAG: hypothetical protein EAZ39_01965 [Oscillatoriales cyanobacterium]TAG47826.1 MAG: hypothetical protein EAZ33_04105 [Oscillatoriales cyanobacterium]
MLMLRSDVQLKPRLYKGSICRVCRPQKCLKVDRKSCSDEPYTIFDATNSKIYGSKIFYKLELLQKSNLPPLVPPYQGGKQE